LQPPNQGQKTKIPVTVVTGFLGAGKSTLLNNILAQTSSNRFAIIVNEFGDIGIDGELLNIGDEELIELSSGCICCVVRGDLIRGLRDLLNRNSDLDGIIIETTGLANPSPVIQTLMIDQVIGAHCRLDSIICVVDAVNIESQLAHSKDASEQITFSDHIIINKSAETSLGVNKIEAIVKELNPFARITKTNRSKISIDRILNQWSFDLAKVELEFLDLETQKDGHLDQTDHNHIDENGITSLTLTSANDLDLERLENWLQDVLTRWGYNILRTKGIISIKDEDRKLVVQAVNMLMEGDFGSHWEDKNRTSKLVFIGRNLEIEALTKGFKLCDAKSHSSD
jgi:G3E family GTPase